MSVDGPADDSNESPMARDHWDRAKPALVEHATIESPNGDITLQTLGKHGKHGWYQTKPAADEDVADGFGEIGGPWLLGEDYDALTAQADRDLYAVLNYHPADAIRDRWTPVRRGDDGREWKGGENPLPEYEDIVAMAPFADVDLAGAVKTRPLDADTQQVVEKALAEYINDFAELLGTRDAVFVLDSVGGAYVFGAPATTVKIGAGFRDDPDARGRIFGELCARMDEWLRETEQRINDQIPDAIGVFEADAIHNKNRLYKAPLSPHKRIDGVVHPLDIDNPSYDFVPLDAVDDDLVDETRAWAEAFTAPDHAECIDSIIGTLWPEYTAEHDDWQAALEAWVEDEHAEEEKQEQRRREAKERLAERTAELDTDLGELPLTTAIDDVYNAVDDIDIRQLVKRHCAEWEPAPASRTDHFNPGSRLWKNSDSGTSCFVNTKENMFVDVGDPGGKGGPAKFMALVRDIITSVDDDLEGEDYWQAVAALREAGYEIPIFVPEAGATNADGNEYEKTPLWALRNAAVALNLIPDDGFVRKEGTDGGSYLDFPGPRTRGDLLDKLDEIGIEHGWEDSDGVHGTLSTSGSDRYDYNLEHPVYTILDPDEGDVEMHIIPIDGTSAGIEITQNGHVEYSEMLDRGFWNSRTIRGRVASEAANTLTGVDQGTLKQGIKDALTRVGVDEREDAETFDEKMRSEREQSLRDRTERVICHPRADNAEWVVTIAPPDESPVTEPQKLSFDQGDFVDQNAGTFKSAHLAKFFAKAELDHEEWDGLTDYWLEQQVTDDYEPDHELDAAVDKLVDWVSNLRVWADEEGFSWSSLHGYYAEDYHDGKDAVLVSGQKVVDWREGENVDPQTNLSKELRDRGVMLTATTKEKIAGKRRRVWPISAEATDHTPETAHHVDGGDGSNDERPEGLR